MVRSSRLTWCVRVATLLLLGLLAGQVASGQDTPSTRERAWAKTVTRAIGSTTATVVPTKSERQIAVTYDDTRVTRTLAADPEEALEVARALVENFRQGAHLIEVRGRQVVQVEAMLVAEAGLPAILEAAWGVLPGGGEPRTAIAMRRGESVVALALGGGALRDLASTWTDSMNDEGYRVGETLLVQGSNELRARRTGPTDCAFAVARHSTQLRELLAAFGPLAPHGLVVDAPRPASPASGEDRGESRDAAVTGDAPAPTERPDLTGAWSVHDQDDGPMRQAGSSPDMVRFSARVAGEPDRYEVVFITSTGQVKGRATFDGETLVVERDPVTTPATPVSVGFVRVIDAVRTGRTATRPASQRSQAASQPRQQGRYTLRASARELEFTVEGQAMPDSAAPVHAFRRLAEPTVVCPAEWEPSDEILWAAGTSFREFALVGVYAAALRSTRDVTHRIFASSAVDELYLDEQLASALGEAHVDTLDALAVTVRPVGRGSVWVRDFGPITVRRKADGARLAGDMGYYSSRPEDDRLPQDYAATRSWDVIDLQRLKLEGGNFMSDGRGKIYVTGRALEGSGEAANDSQRAVEDALFELGAREVCWVPRMTHADGTGHIDMFSKLLSAGSVLVGRDAGGPHAAMLDDAARRYEAMGLEVVRVDMAHNPTVDAEARDLQTYTNALFIGRVAIVPQYDVAESDRAALAVYRRAGYTAVGADVRAVIGANGAIHCVSMQIPGGK